MSAWLLVAALGAGTFLLRLAGASSSTWLRRSPRGLRVIGYVAPAVLGGLVAVATFGAGEGLTLDSRAAGVGVAVVAVLLRAPVLLTVAVAVVVTAAVRALT